MTPKERADRALDLVRSMGWTHAAFVAVVEQEIAAAVASENRRCARIAGCYCDAGAQAAAREIRRRAAPASPAGGAG